MRWLPNVGETVDRLPTPNCRSKQLTEPDATAVTQFNEHYHAIRKKLARDIYASEQACPDAL